MTDSLTNLLKAAIDATLEFQAMPVHYAKTRNGWAGYRGNDFFRRRITKFYFSEEGAREAVTAWEASDVKVTFVDPEVVDPE